METKQKKTSRPAGKKPAAVRERTQPKKPTPRKREQKPKISQDVVYLPPKPFSRHRMVLRLATVVAVVIAIVLGMSVFFKVEEFSISGTEKYTPWEISQASGIKEGDNLLLLNRAEAGGKIKALLPYVKTVRVGIKLPGTVHIEIEELDVTYAVSNGSDWWLISAAGTVVEKLESMAEDDYTKLLGVQLFNPQPGKQAEAMEAGLTVTDPDGQTVPVTVTGADRLNTALDILEYLEKNGVIGQAESIDVNNMGDIQIWYGDKFQVKLGDSKELGMKISMMMATIRSLEQDKPYERGVLNVADPNNIYYNSFE